MFLILAKYVADLVNQVCNRVNKVHDLNIKVPYLLMEVCDLVIADLNRSLREGPAQPFTA
jgi:hypothetical protein